MSWFRSEDFPTFGRPTMATRASLGSSARTVPLVHDRNHRNSEVAQPGADFPVLRDKAGITVKQEKHRIGFAHRSIGLRTDQGHEGVGVLKQEAAGVHERHNATPPRGVTNDPVSRNPGKIVHQRPPAASQAVENCRFADVRSADDDNNWLTAHDVFPAAPDASSNFQRGPISSPITLLAVIIQDPSIRRS